MLHGRLRLDGRYTTGAGFHSVNVKWVASDTGNMARKMWPRLNKRLTVGLLRLWRSSGGNLIEIFTGLKYMVNDFC